MNVHTMTDYMAQNGRLFNEKHFLNAQMCKVNRVLCHIIRSVLMRL